ncbi:tRNA (guanine(10)-N(2))-dimethyltransferase, partial [Candidatus Woesearchaeota archaeon]|nr:tRNA (guanine(10)-N(2))-dimethyltransferase [Candidatus Woesearchaeota archaeon]
MKQIKHVEGSAEIFVPVAEKVCKDMPVFFNPVMKFNRDVCICLLQCIGRHLKVGDALAGTGIRAIRIAKEVADCDVFMNDFSHDAFLLMKKNAKRNRVSAVISNKNAHDFLCQGFDYVDIDPFGSPNPFLDSAVRAVRNKGILAITATDTAPLCGTYPKACLRKYWAHTLKNPAMHETGIRILIRKVQLIGSQYDRALIPVFSHSTQHYFRVYFRLEKGKNDVDEVLRSHELVRFGNKIIGPLWTGQ